MPPSAATAYAEYAVLSSKPVIDALVSVDAALTAIVPLATTVVEPYVAVCVVTCAAVGGVSSSSMR